MTSKIETQWQGCKSEKPIIVVISHPHVADGDPRRLEEIEKELMSSLPQEAHESRISNLIQSLLIAACLGKLSGP